MPVEALAVRVSALGLTTKPALGARSRGGPRGLGAAAAAPGLVAGQRGLRETPVYDGPALGPGSAVAGPAVVELANTTIVVLDGFDLSVDRFGAFVLASGERGRELASRLAGAAAAA